MFDFISQYSSFLICFSIVPVIGIVWMIFFNKRYNKIKTDYLSNHPDCARVFLTSRFAIASEAVEVHSVNDETPALFNKGAKGGFYVKPGTNVIEISYSHTRPGVFYKTVTKSTGIMAQQIEVEAEKTYRLGFNRDAETFIFEEIPEADL